MQVGYWKDLLEIVVRACTSPEYMKQRAQHSQKNKLAEANRKAQAITKDDKNTTKGHAHEVDDAHLRDIQATSERHQNLLVVQALDACSIGAVGLPLGPMLVCWE